MSQKTLQFGSPFFYSSWTRIELSDERLGAFARGKMFVHVPQKKTIKASEILEDIRAGMDDSALMRKYGLSDKGLRQLYGKLADAGAWKKLDSDGHAAQAQHTLEPFHHSSAEVAWRCPACNAPQSQAYEECPRCGVVVAKVGAARRPGYEVPLPAAKHSDESDSTNRSRWAFVGLSLVIFIILGAALIKWSWHRTGTTGTGAESGAPEGLRRFTLKTFQKEVVAESETRPVVLEFYADT